MLFLFQIYEYADGVKSTCEKLNLKQELINFYIAQKMPDKVFEVAKGTGVQMMCLSPDQAKVFDSDLWIQILMYFRDIKNPDDCEKYLSLALEFIGEHNILSPLLVL